MSSQGPLYTATGVNDTGVGGTAWGNPSSINSPSDYASCYLTGYTTSNYLKGTNCGFTIPSGATIDGIEVTFRVFRYTGNADFSYVRLVVGGSITGNNLASGSVPTGGFSSVTFGGPTELWGLSPSYTQVNASNFGVAMAISAGASGAGVYCDYFQVKVYYTAGGGGGGGPSGTYWADSWMTFRSVGIPKGATINKAFVRFTAKSGTGAAATVTNTDDTVTAMVFGNAVDSSSPPTDLATYSAKSLTTACQSWSSIAHWTDETTYDTPDIACVIQEIVDRSGWASGNNISIYVQNNYTTETSLSDIGRRAYDYGTSTSKAPQLYVYYTQDVTTSGGVLGGGSALAGRLYQPSITSAGALAAGSATTAVTRNITLTAAGALAGGSATVSGGHSVYSEAGSGGALISGGGSMDQTVIITPAGLTAGGSATVSGSQNISMSGGVRCAGPRWKYRRSLTVPTGSVSTTIDKFYLPIAVQLDPAKASASVYVTDSANKSLAFEVREYDATSGRLWLVVKTPLPSASSTTIYLYYGDDQ